MSIEELKKDEAELAKLLTEATRSRTKDILTRAKAEVEKEIVNLEMKERIAAERKAGGQDQENKRYTCELTEYAWDQSDKFVKFFVTLDGVQNLDEANVKVTYTENSMQLLVSDLNDYVLTINNLLQSIDVEKSYRKVKTGIVSIYLKKRAEGQHWDHLTTIHKRIKDKKDSELKPDMDNPDNALVNIMKKMYNEGDTKTKQMIAKAWTESQEKAHTGQGPELPTIE